MTTTPLQIVCRQGSAPAHTRSSPHLGRLSAVKPLLNLRRDGLDLSAKLLLDLIEVQPVVISDQVDGESEVTEPSRASHSMKVGLRVLGEVKVDDDVDRLDVNATGEEIGGDEVAAMAVAEVVEHPVPMALLHLGMDVEAGVAELCDFLGQQLHSVDRVAKDD